MRETFGERLRELRKESGLSIAALSREVKIPASSLCRWENGKQDIVSYNLIILANYFHVSAGYLLGLED